MSTLLSPGRSSSPQPLPSLPPSEEDLGRPIGWANRDDNTPDSEPPDQRRKGKERATDESLQPSYAEGGTDDALMHLDENRGNAEAYPPMTEDEAETRRIEENLRRWEASERERRKAARSSTGSTVSVPSTSLVANVARRASLLWAGRDARPPTDGGVGAHRALGTSEDAMPLDDITASPSPSPTPTRTTTPISSKPADSRNPFSDPIGDSASTSSLFVNQPASSVPPSDPRYLSLSARPPAPLDIPRPRSPPPRTATPHANRPPEPMPPPNSTRASTSLPRDDEDEKPVRWWHDWLCGCGEGEDRGGEIQAGATNPME